jgi:hypothetical protein
MLLEPNEASTSDATSTSAVPVEIPHPDSITIPPLPGSSVQASLRDLEYVEGTWYIRANQGHSIKVISSYSYYG